MSKKKLMTADEITKLLKISKTTLHTYVDKGWIGKWQPGGANHAARYYLIEKGDN